MCNSLKDGTEIDMYGISKLCTETIPIEQDTINREKTGVKSGQKGISTTLYLPKNMGKSEIPESSEIDTQPI